jgi:hypothetical protein
MLSAQLPCGHRTKRMLVALAEALQIDPQRSLFLAPAATKEGLSDTRTAPGGHAFCFGLLEKMCLSADVGRAPFGLARAEGPF